MFIPEVLSAHPGSGAAILRYGNFHEHARNAVQMSEEVLSPGANSNPVADRIMVHTVYSTDCMGQTLVQTFKLLVARHGGRVIFKFDPIVVESSTKNLTVRTAKS